jgi:hypothetical protein
MFLLDPDRLRRMSVPIEFRAEAEQESEDDKRDDAFFFRRENKFVPQLSPSPAVRQIQSS